MISGNGWHELFIQDPITKETKPLTTARSMVDELTQQLLQTEYCIVIDNGLCYATYDDWIRKNFGWYITYFEYNHSLADIKSDRLYKIIGHAPHGSYDRELYLIQDWDTKQVFIIEEEGIKKTTHVTAIKNTNTIYCDDSLDATRYTYNIRGEERNMNNKIVDLYYERRKEGIKEDFKAMLEEEYNNNPVVKEYNELVGTFEASLAELANRYNTEEETVLIKSGYKGEYGYVLNESLKTKLTGDLKASYDAEIKDLELLIEEVRAMLSFSDNEEHRMDVLKKYEIVDKKGKLNV